MTNYRAYRMKGSHVDGIPTILEATDDQDAIEQAKALRDASDLEIWDGPRRVARVMAQDHK